MKLICVTNRQLCREPFFTRLERIASARPDCIILREKDLSETEYERFAVSCQEICARYQAPLTLHFHSQAAIALQASSLHLPLWKWQEQQNHLPSDISIGTSVHKAEEAVLAERMGASYLIAGHIFDTNCKQGLPGRGVAFLHDVCQSVAIPVYAIGGIAEERIPSVRQAGAAGICIMSELMQCEQVEGRIKRIKQTLLE